MTVALAVFMPEGNRLPLIPALFWLAVVAVMFCFSQKWKKLHPVVIICICGAIGILAGYLGL